jgi:hypothetical protein
MNTEQVMTENGRTVGGQFAEGNPGGPGRPRRAIERDYLAALSDACGPETWREIVERAVADAKNGDAKAREWLAHYLLGIPALGWLHKLAVEELTDPDPVGAEVERRQTRAEQEQTVAELLRARGLKPGSFEWTMAEIELMTELTASSRAGKAPAGSS